MSKNLILLSDLREEIHRKSHEHLFFRQHRREKNDWSQFYGCLDSILDTLTGLSGLLSSNRNVTILECYGFLQALVTQQDAVRYLSNSIGLTDWNPDGQKCLKKIRNSRNKICAHSAWSDRGEGGISTSVIGLGDLAKGSFLSHIYYENKMETVTVNFDSYISDNRKPLETQMRKISKKMDELEETFRAEFRDTPLSDHLNNVGYLIQRLHCELNDEDRLPQAKGHAKMLRKIFEELLQTIKTKNLEEDIYVEGFEICLHGLTLIEEVLYIEEPKSENQWTLDLLFNGWELTYSHALESVQDFDEKMKTKPS